MSIICDGQEIDVIIGEFGVDVPLSSVVETEEGDAYGSPIYTETPVTLKVIVEKVGAEEDRVREGYFRAGDLFIHFRTQDSDYAKVGNFITYGGKKYKITRVDIEERASITYVIGAKAEIF